MATETLYPQDHTDSAFKWTNPSYCYNEDGTTSSAVLDKNLSYDDVTESLLLYNWETKTEVHTALYIKAMWETNDDSGDDEWALEVSIDGGTNYDYDLLAMGTNRNNGVTPIIANASVEIPAGTSMSNVRVRVRLEKVKTADGDTLTLHEVWAEGTYTPGVTVTPSAATAVTASVAPTVVRGSITISSLLGTVVSAVVAPAVILGSVSSAPDPATAIPVSIDPTVAIAGGGTTVTPDPATAIPVSIDPTVVAPYWSVCGSRVAESTFASTSPDIRDWIENEDVDITGHDKSEYVILAVGLEKIATASTNQFRPDLYWRNITDAGSWTKISNSSGEIRITTTDATDLVNATQVDEAEAGCTSATSYWGGYETEGETDNPINVLGNSTASWGESHCALDLTNALDGKEYGFRLDDKDRSTGIVGGTTIVTITTAAGVEVTPSPATVIPTVVAPTVLYGNVTAAPSAATAVPVAVAPTVVYGDVTVAPSASTVVAVSIDPTVDIGSGNVSVTPNPATVISVSVAPTTALGSTIATPSASTAVAVSVAPTVVCGSIIVAPSASTAVPVTVAPTVVYGSVTAAPSASTVIAVSVAPTVVCGSISITSSVATAVSAVVAPTVVYGSLVATPTSAHAIAASIDPTVDLGGVTYIYDIQSSYSQSTTGAFSYYPGDDSNTFETG